MSTVTVKEGQIAIAVFLPPNEGVNRMIADARRLMAEGIEPPAPSQLQLFIDKAMEQLGLVDGGYNLDAFTNLNASEFVLIFEEGKEPTKKAIKIVGCLQKQGFAITRYCANGKTTLLVGTGS